MNLNSTEQAAAQRLAGVLGAVLVMDVDVTPVAPAAISEPPSVRTGKCTCCGMRRDLVAHTSLAAADADLCFRCGSDRAQGLGYCSSAPREYTRTFSDDDWTA
jgi:hypothetical protein